MVQRQMNRNLTRWQTRLAAVFVAGLLATACAGEVATSPPPSVPVASAHPSRLARFPSSLVVSVLAFDDRTGVPELAWLKTGLPDMLVAELATIPSVVIVQRARLDAVIREQVLHLSGRVADESAVRVGRLVGASVLVTGSVILVNGLIRIDAQLVGVEQGTILGTAAVEGPQREAPALARVLVAKVVELFRPEGDRIQSDGPGTPATSALDPVPPSSRPERLFQELTALEQAHDRPPEPPGPIDQAGIILEEAPQTVRPLPQAVRPLIDRLLGSAFTVTIGPLRTEPTPDGLVTVRLPVRLAVRPAVVHAATELVRALGGEVRLQPDALEIHFAHRTPASRAVIDALAHPRRFYLRLLAADGRTLAIYSGFRHWRLSQWIAVKDHEWVRIEQGKVVTGESMVHGLSPEQVAGVSTAKVSLEAVPREQAMVQVEWAFPPPPAEPSSKLPLLWGDVPATTPSGARPRTPPRREAVSEGEPSLVALRSAIERLWDPPVTERTWGHGHVPSNERVTVVTATIGAGPPSPTVAVRVVRTSGDRQFDEAAVAAIEQAVLLWWSAPEPDQTHARLHAGTDPAEPGQSLMVRVQFRLLNDLPALNLSPPPGTS